MNNLDEQWIAEEEAIAEESGDFEAEIFLSTDGKHTVRVKAQTQAGRKDALMWAKQVYNRIVAVYGTKQAQAVKEYTRGDKVDNNNELGNCKSCGAINLKSKKGNAYCSKRCWIPK